MLRETGEEHDKFNVTEERGWEASKSQDDGQLHVIHKDIKEDVG